MDSFVILLTIIAFAWGDTRFLNVKEGEETSLDFNYTCDSPVITLQYGIRAPFYDSASPNPMSLPENQELLVHNDTGSSNCSVQLKINPVSRSDDGGYILTLYSDDRIYQGYKRIGLRVDYPPGKASCEWNAKNIADDWGSMLCKAPAGSNSGQIICYQNEQRRPPRDMPTEVGKILKQNIMVRYNRTAFCCASLQETPVDRCACKDFVWNPSHNGSIEDPCAATPQESALSGPSQLAEDDKSNTSLITVSPRYETTKITPNEKKYVSVYWGVGVIFSTLVLLIIVQCIVLASAFRKIRQLCEDRNRRNMKSTQNGDYTKVPTVEVQL